MPNEYQAGRRLCLICVPPVGGFFSQLRRNIMKNLMTSMQRFVQDEEGVTAIEYGLIASLIAVVIIAGAGLVGTNLNAVFNGIAGYLIAP